ncbi:MAG: DUF559 domain-containing protein [Rickettsiales bacterium]|jgi:very-short-patch-repair endonuclease|nr:DUF559 domain-containing protein [Rickettsiales bacterium]
MKLQKPNNLFKNRARELRKNGTLSEALLWNQLKNRQLAGLDFDRQKVINNRYIADFYCAAHNLIIEIDGCSHEVKYEHDLERQDYLIGLGFKVLHIDDLDIKTNLEGVLSYIKEEINKV